MLQSSRFYFGLLFGGAFLLILGAAGLHLRQVGVTAEQIEAAMQQDFIDFLAETREESEQILAGYEPGQLLPEDEQLVRIMYGSQCQLLQWSNPERMPSQRMMVSYCNYPDRSKFTNNNKEFYLLRTATEKYQLVTLIPVHINYKVNNAFLKPDLFLGRYANDPAVRNRINQFDVYYKQVEGAINIFDETGRFVYCVEVPDLEVFSYVQRDWVVGLALAGLLLLVLGFYQLWVGKVWRLGKLRVSGVLVFLGMLFGLRILVFYLNLPQSYRPYELFSPSILAIDARSPSLGDLFLNVALLLITTRLLLHEYRRWISRFFKWALHTEYMAWAVQCFTLAVCGLVTYAFFQLCEDVVRHSTIYFEFSELFELTGYSYLAFGILAAVLITLQLVLLELLRFSFHFFSGKGGTYKAVLSLLFLGGLSFLLFGFQTAYLVSVPLVFGLTILVFIRTKRAMVFKLDLLNFLILITIFSLLTTIGMVEGSNIRMRMEMQQLADRQSDQHDLITESLFERVVQDVEAESYQLDYKDERGLSTLLKERFFDSNFKGYEVRISIYNEAWERLDSTSSVQVYAPTDSSFALEELGRSTMTNNLYIAPYNSGIFGSIYIGQFDLLLRSLGRIKVLVELEPTEFQANRLYPQLLLDDNIRSNAVIPDGYAYAVYKDQMLTRKHSSEPFPFYFEGPSSLDSLIYLHSNDVTYNHTYYRANEDKVVHVRTARRSLFDSANLFSFIFYFFILGTIALMLPIWIVRLIRNPRQFRHLKLKDRIQLFFLSIAILPLVIVVFVISPYIRDHIYDDLKNDVQEQTQQIQNLLRDDYIRLWQDPGYFAQNEVQLQARIKEMEKTLLHDINIYSSQGRLHLTTQPAIYELGLTSRYMNPEVYRSLQYGLVSDVVKEESIGNITYFSTFYPILSPEQRILGFLNIPYYKNQDQVNEQSLSLLTLLVNIYVFIFMAIGILAVLISNSIIRPLAILNRQLRATNLGKRNEPIEWDARDEIGDIIQAYNDMLQQLEEAEANLARTERESAWKEMARQVAHEIKNPLTPMRLSVQHLVQVWKIRPPDNEKLTKLFNKVTGTVLVQIEQLVNIANSFSQFAKMPEPQRTTFDLREVVREVFDLYSHDDAVQLELHIPEEEFLVHSDRDQLSRVFNNVIKNAKQAIEHEEGRIVVAMKTEGKLAKVTVRDNGKGIPEEIRGRVFEPKFSTKTSGMGLGLAMVRKIVQTSGGRIYFETEVGAGTTFIIELPAAKV